MARKIQPAKKRTEIEVRRKNAVKLRVAGATDAEIAERLGYPSTKAVRTDISRALKKYAREDTRELLELELMRLDHLTKGLMHEFDQGDPKMADQILRVMTRRSAYLGLDIDHRKDTGNSDVDQWLAGIVGDKPDLELDPDDVLGEEIEEVDDLE